MSITGVTATKNNKNNSSSFLDNRATAVVAPKSSPGISGWEFDIPETETVRLMSDITDHYTENNAFINDHIVHKPIEITLTGLIGELVYRSPGGIPGQLQELSNKLETINAYLGDYTPGMTQNIQRSIIRANKTVSNINTVIDKTKNIVSALSGAGPEQTLQQKAYKELWALWRTKQLVTVQTPWDYFESMIIKELSFSQSGDTRYSTTISITLKEFRYADIEINSFEENIDPVREEIQSAEEENIGIVNGPRDSLLFDIGESTGFIENGKLVQ